MTVVETATDDETLNGFPSKDDDDAKPDDCDCEGLSGFPCWLWVRTGRTDLPNEPPLQFFKSMSSRGYKSTAPVITDFAANLLEQKMS